MICGLTNHYEKWKIKKEKGKSLLCGDSAMHSTPEKIFCIKDGYLTQCDYK